MRVPRKPVFWAVGLGHTINDIFMSMGPVLLAFISGNVLPISNAQIGLAQSLRQMTGAISQPGFGWQADRSGGRWLGALGVAWTISGTVLGVVLLVMTGNFWLFMVPYILAAVGSGAFHPVGAMHAAEADPTYKATYVSWFFLMGQMGLALGPLLAGLLLQTAVVLDTGALFVPGPLLDGRAVASAPASSLLAVLVVAPLVVIPVTLMARLIPDMLRHRETHPLRPRGEAAPPLRLPARATGTLLLLVVLRSLAQPGSVAFIPVLFENKGWSPSEYGVITSSFWIASGLAGVYFGGLADRFGTRLILLASMVASAPAFFLLPHADGALAFTLAIAAGALAGGSHSLIVVQAQDLLPSGKGFASGAILGTIFGVGAAGTFVIGLLSDSIGLTSAFHLVGISIGLAGLTALLLPAASPPPPPVVPEVEEVAPAPAGD